MNEKKLILHERVEVRQFEIGLRGSWHAGVVVRVSELCRSVNYDDLLCEKGQSKLIECIHVTEAIEGLHKRRHVQTTYRGHIRPFPPAYLSSTCEPQMKFGTCVDAYFKDAWWEGVIFDFNVDSNERYVYFPDEGDERKFKVSNLRVSHEWDEFLGLWKDRGSWVLVELAMNINKDDLPKFIKEVWGSLQLQYGFMKMISEWTCGGRSLWNIHFKEVVHRIMDKKVYQDTQNVIHSTCTVSKAKQMIPEQVGDDGSRKLDVQLIGQEDFNCVINNHKRRKKHSVEYKLKTKRRSLRLGNMNSAGVPITNTGKQVGDSCQGSLTVGCAIISGDATSGYKLSSKSRKRMADTELLPGKRVKSHKVNGQYNASQDYHFQRKRKAFPLLWQEKQIIRRKSRSRLGRVRNNSKAGLGAGMVRTVSHGISDVQRNQTVVKEGGLIGLLGTTSSTRSNQNCSPAGNRNSADLNQSVGNTRPPAKEEGKLLNALREQDVVCVYSKPLIMHRDPSDGKVSLNEKLFFPLNGKRRREYPASRPVDKICIVCHYGGDLIYCDGCTSSYHLSCSDLEVVPDGNWFCPSCCCGPCGLRNPNCDTQKFTSICDQCGLQYHLDCLSESDCLLYQCNQSMKFCSTKCSQLYARLEQLLGTSNSTSSEGITWTLLKQTKVSDTSLQGAERGDVRRKLTLALGVLRDCFQPVIDPYTKKNIIVNVVRSKRSILRRLDFHGFYIMVLQKGDDVACVATVRIYGYKVAEMPLVATNFQYRQKGLCRLLVQELEKMLSSMGVERLTLPAVSHLRETWKSSFGFAEMPNSERRDLLAYPLLAFQGTTMFHKVLHKSSGASQNCNQTEAGLSQESVNFPDDNRRFCDLVYHRRRPGTTSLAKKHNHKRSCAYVESYVYRQRRVQANKVVSNCG